jgi:hypothetical protein
MTEHWRVLGFLVTPAIGIPDHGRALEDSGLSSGFSLMPRGSDVVFNFSQGSQYRFG